MTVSSRRACGSILAVTIGVLGTGAIPTAHPGSTTTVAIDVKGSAIAVTIVSDAPALITKLEIAPIGPGLPSPRATGQTPAELASRLEGLSDTLVEQLDLRLDGTVVALSVNQISVDRTDEATIHLMGATTEPARTLTWSTTLVYGAYPLAVRASRHETVRWLQGRETSEVVTLDAGGTQRFGRGVWLGFTHILPKGLDHILFVVGLLLLTTRASQLLLQVSAFTLAHTLTLGLSLYGIMALPAGIVEPLIALSVAYVGLENLVSSRLHAWRVAIVFAFGLLHGLGFAEAVASLNVSRDDLLATLVSFNVGVELGQLTVIAGAAAMLCGVLRARRLEWRRPVARLASCVVGLMGLIWTVERVLT